jgi:uncharacterized protein YegP (UPF0339 family)
MTNVERVKVFKGVDGNWWWHAQAANNKIVARDEGFTERNDAIEAVERVFPGVPIEPEEPYKDPIGSDLETG